MQSPSQKFQFALQPSPHLVFYVASHREKVLTHMYKNILAGKMKYVWQRTFFIKMAEKLGKSESQAKLDFYRLETQLYLKVLQVSPEDFEVFLNLPIPDNRNKVLHLRPSFSLPADLKGRGSDKPSFAELSKRHCLLNSSKVSDSPGESTGSKNAEKAHQRDLRRFAVAREFLEGKWPKGIKYKSKALELANPKF